jgi:cation diffusion facilitator family transporter
VQPSLARDGDRRPVVVDARDHNIRAAYMHVLADAAVSVLAIIGLLFARQFGWLWMDPLAGIVGALVIANWSYSLIRVTGGILLDVSPDERLIDKVRSTVASAGDTLVDLHVWRLGPGHFGAVVSVVSQVAGRGPAFYHALLRKYDGLSHITVEVHTVK